MTIQFLIQIFFISFRFVLIYCGVCSFPWVTAWWTWTFDHLYLLRPPIIFSHLLCTLRPFRFRLRKMTIHLGVPLPATTAIITILLSEWGTDSVTVVLLACNSHHRIGFACCANGSAYAAHLLLRGKLWSCERESALCYTQRMCANATVRVCESVSAKVHFVPETNVKSENINFNSFARQ